MDGLIQGPPCRLVQEGHEPPWRPPQGVSSAHGSGLSSGERQRPCLLAWWPDSAREQGGSSLLVCLPGRPLPPQPPSAWTRGGGCLLSPEPRVPAEPHLTHLDRTCSYAPSVATPGLPSCGCNSLVWLQSRFWNIPLEIERLKQREASGKGLSMDTSLVSMGEGTCLEGGSRCAYVPCGLLARVPVCVPLPG